MWGAVDSQKLASSKTLTKQDLITSTIWSWALPIVLKDFTYFNEVDHVIFHDYTNIETWM